MEVRDPSELPSDHRPAAWVAILAGGAGSRMGAPKAALELAGRPMISYAIEAAESAGLLPLVVTKAGIPVPSLGCTRLEEPTEPRHPLTGLVAALEHCGGPVVVLACDAPLVSPALLARLAAIPAAFAMPTHPRPQPLVSRYGHGLLPRLRAALEERRSMTALAAQLGGVRLAEDELRELGDPEWMFANANEPGELERIAAEIERRRQAA